MYEEIQFPSEPILELVFYKPEDAYETVLAGQCYMVVGKDKDLPDRLIGVASDKRVYELDDAQKQVFYAAPDLAIFVRELMLWRSYGKQHPQPDNMAEAQLSAAAAGFREKLTELDRHAFDREDTFWSMVCEELEYGI